MPRHQYSGAPTFFGAFFLYYEPVCAGNTLIKLENIGDTWRLLEKKTIKILIIVLDSKKVRSEKVKE